MTVARVLDVVAATLVVALAVVIATGSVPLGAVAVTRPEDLVVAFVGVVAARLLVAPVALPAWRPVRTVAAATALYVLLMGFIVVTRHFALRTHALDLGYYVQLVWSIAAGFGARVTLPAMHAWGDHLSPVLYLLVPLGWLAPGAPALLLAQTIVFAAGAWAVFGLARTQPATRPLAAAFAVLYLLNPSLHGMNVRDFHPAAFVTPFVLAAALAFDRRRYGACAAALALTLACREDAAVAVVGFGIWLALARRAWAAGGAVAVLALLVLAADVYYVMPYFRGEPYPHLHRYPHLGGSIGEILTTLLVRPWRWMAVVLSGSKVLYLLALLVPVGFLPLRAPSALAAAMPGLAMNLLSLDPILFHHRSQYQAFVVPFVFLAAVEGAGRLASGDRRLFGRPVVSVLLVGAVLASLALSARTVNDFAVSRWRQETFQRGAYALMRRVPAEAAVSANDRVVPHLATRREVYLFTDGVDRAEYILDFEGQAAVVPADRFELVGRESPWALWRRR